MDKKKMNLDELSSKANMLDDQQKLNTKGGYYIPRRRGSSFWWVRGGGVIEDDIDIRTRSQQINSPEG